MGGRDQSQVIIKFKKFEKVKSIPSDVPKSHNDDTSHFVIEVLPLSGELEPSLVIDLWQCNSRW